jgi:hypothetical protein
MIKVSTSLFLKPVGTWVKYLLIFDTPQCPLFRFSGRVEQQWAPTPGTYEPTKNVTFCAEQVREENKT